MKTNFKTALLSLALFVCSIVTTYAQQPTIMVIPSDALLSKLGCITETNINGTSDFVPDYKKAFVKDPDLVQVISKIGELFTERGFNLSDLSQTMKEIGQESAVDRARNTSRNNGGLLLSDELDEVLNVARPDFILELTYDVKQAGGPMRAVSFTLTAKDAYSRKQVAASSGVGPNSTEQIVMRLVQQAVLTHIPNLQSQMQQHFNDIKANGREISCRVQIYANAGFDLNEEFGSNYDTLSDIIYDWTKNNSVRRSSRITHNTRAEFRCAVRIPITNPDNSSDPYSAREYARRLRRELSSKYGIKSEDATQGIGDAHILIQGRR